MDLDLYWSEKDKHFHRVQDGEITTHEEIKNSIIDNCIRKNEIIKILKEIQIDVERNKRRKIEHVVKDNSIAWTDMMIYYDPEIVKARLENLLYWGWK